MIRFLTNLGIALAIASLIALLGASIALPLIAFAAWLPTPWTAVAAIIYGVFWFCVVMAAVVTLEDS